MAKLNFITQLWFRPDIPDVKGDSNFSRFIFQVKNDDTSAKNDFALMVYGRNREGLDYPAGLKHDSLVSDLGTYLPSKKRVNIANLVMTREQLASVWPVSMHHLRFWAINDPNYNDYVTYNVRPEDKDNNPLTYVESPYEIYEKETQFNFGDKWDVYEEKIEVNGTVRLFVVIKLNPSPPATSG